LLFFSSVKQLTSETISKEINELDKERFFHLPKQFPPKNDNQTKKFKVLPEPKSMDEDFVEKVDIPEKDFVEGALYKMRDCYYDSNGDFLYRVPIPQQ